MIVYDDGSTDNTVKILSKFPVKVIIGKKNKGIGFARNKLVEEANGKYLCFMSADDIMKPNYIEVMLETAKKHPNTILYCNYEVIDENGTIVNEVIAPIYDNYEDWVISNIIRAKSNTMCVCYNIFAPAKLLKENNFDKTLRYGEDLEHLLRCTLVKKIKYFNVDKFLFLYRTHMKATTTIKRNKIPENNKKIFKKINRMLGRKVL